MKRLILTVGFCLLYSAAFAQVLLPVIQTPIGGGPPPSYTGPGDIAGGALVWYGMRCYSAAQASLAAAIRLQRDSDSTTQDIGLTASCALDTASAATFCMGTTCHVTKLYNQGSLGTDQDGILAGTASIPIYQEACDGGKPCLIFSSPSQVYASFATDAQVTQPCSVAAVFKDTTAGANFMQVVAGDASFNYELYSQSLGGADISWFINAVDHFVSGTPNGNVYAAAGANVSGASASFIKAAGNTTTFTSTDGCSGAGGLRTVIGNSGASGQWFEGGIWGVGFTTTEGDNEIANMETYYIPSACAGALNTDQSDACNSITIPILGM